MKNTLIIGRIESKVLYSFFQNLGKFHALPIALRILRPKIFDIKVLPCLQGINLFEAIDIDCALTKVNSLVMNVFGIGLLIIFEFLNFRISNRAFAEQCVVLKI